MRGRLDWSLGRILRVLLTAESIESDNDSSGVGYETETERYAIDLNLTPTDNFMIRAAWDSYDTDTEIPIRVPQTFDVVPSIYAEEGEMIEGGLMWKIAIVTLEAAYSTFENTGSFAFDFDRAYARIAVDLSERFAVTGEYENWDYSEDSFPVADYDADRWGLFLRWRR